MSVDSLQVVKIIRSNTSSSPEVYDGLLKRTEGLEPDERGAMGTQSKLDMRVFVNEPIARDSSSIELRQCLSRIVSRILV